MTEAVKAIQFWMVWQSAKRLFAIKKESPERGTPERVVITGYAHGATMFLHTMIRTGYEYNYFSNEYKGQICNVRRSFMEGGKIMQHHLRLFDDGVVVAHTEVAYEHDAREHLDGIGLSNIYAVERAKLIEVLQ